MPASTITFAPELDERQLDREMRDIDDTLSDVASGVPASFDSKRGVDQLRGDLEDATDELTANIEADMDSLTPATGGAGGMAEAGGGPGGGTAAGAGALASRIPKPVAGVAAAAALPVALSGGVGMGMLSAMESSSARLQTSNQLLGVAWDNIWRAPGDLLDEEVVRPLSKAFLDFSVDFDEIFRGQGAGAGLEFLATGSDPEQAGVLERFGGGLGTGAGMLAGGAAGAKAGGALGATVGSIVPGAGTAAGGTAGAVTGAIVGAIAGTPIGGRVGSAIGEEIDGIMDAFSWPELPEFSWPALPEFPGWPDVKADWPGWPNVGDLWPGWPSIDAEWPGWPDIGSLWPGWPTLSATGVLSETFGVSISGRDIVGAIDWPDISASSITGGGVSQSIRDTFDLGSGNYRGGTVRQSGPANVHRGEIIGRPETIMRELTNAISDTASGGGGGGEMDTSNLENKLDRLHRDLMNLRSAMDVTVQVGEETIARAATNGRQNRLGDTDPTI